MTQHLDELVGQGFEVVTRDDGVLPLGYTILAQEKTYVVCGPNGFRSGFCGSYDTALSWGQARAFHQSDRYPAVGELWDYAGRIAVICGNSISEQKTLWVMDWNSGDRADAPVGQLALREDRKTLSETVLVARFGEWARAGNSNAMWWLAWWFEGTNHPKSVWYYVAALRADPREHDWALDRIRGDARSPGLCEGTPQPDLSFLAGIPEMRGQAVGADWAAAVDQAERAVHMPAI